MTATPAAAHALVQPLSDWAFGPAPRRNTRQVRIGGVAVGGDAPVVVQSMTNTDTADVASTVKQRSEEHTSELQSLMRTSYAVFCLKKKNNKQQKPNTHIR